MNGESLPPLFGTLREIARETARRLGKEVRLHLAGALPDRNADEIARIREALAQALRNAIDHGIESPSMRESAGKPRIGGIWVTFAEENGQTVVTVRDDGAGVDLSAVARKAVDLGIANASERLDARQTHAFLFHPGFSTKSAVTEISGRGIGLDIVRSVVDSFSGSAEIDTVRGEGTTLVLRIPRKNIATAA